MSVQEINPRQELNDSIFSNGKEKELFKRECPHCYSKEVTVYSHIKLKIMGRERCLSVKNVSHYFRANASYF